MTKKPQSELALKLIATLSHVPTHVRVIAQILGISEPEARRLIYSVTRDSRSPAIMNVFGYGYFLYPIDPNWRKPYKVVTGWNARARNKQRFDA